MSKYLRDQASARDAIRQRLVGHRALPITDTPAMPVTSSRPVETSSGLEGLLQQIVANLAPKGVAQTPTQDLRVAPGGVSRASGDGGGGYQDEGGGLGGMLNNLLNAKGEKKGTEQPTAAAAPGSRGGGKASVRDAAVRGRHGAEPAAPTIPGPYGKPMPPPGTTVTGPKDYGGGTGGGVAGDVPGLPGGPSGRALTPEERKAAAGATAEGGRVLAGGNLKGVDPRVAEIVGAAAEGLPPGYKVRPTPSGGMRDVGQGQHTKGKAVDWEIIGPDGKAVSNRGDDTTGLYTELARNAYGYQEKHHPDLTGQFQWGGQFGTSAKNPNEPDLMHFDIGGRRGRITKYSRETIGAKLPPAAGAAPAAGTGTDALKTVDPKERMTAPATGKGPPVPPELEKLVMNKEWFVGKPVDDYGQKTIGYGTEANGRTSITEPEARAEMNARLSQHLAKIDANFPNLPPAVRNSVASLTYNVGEGWMSEKNNNLAAALKAGDMKAAKQAFVQYNKVTVNGQKQVLQGLVNRRTDEARAFDGQQPQYTPNPDAPKGSSANPQTAAAPATGEIQGTPAILQPRQGAPASATASAPSATVAEKPVETTTPSATATTPDVFEKGAEAVPVPGVGGMQEDVDYAGMQPTTTTTQDSAGAALNAIPKPAAAVAPSPPAAATTAAPVVAAAPPPSAAAAPPPPPRAAAPPPPPPKAATPPLTPAEVAKPKGPDLAGLHKALDTNFISFIKGQGAGPAEIAQAGPLSGYTVREALNSPIYGRILRGNAGFQGTVAKELKKYGVDPRDFDKHVATPPPPGKQSAVQGTSDATDFSARARTPMAPPGLDIVRADQVVSGTNRPLTEIEGKELVERIELNQKARTEGRPELPLDGPAPGRPDLPPKAVRAPVTVDETGGLPDLPPRGETAPQPQSAAPQITPEMAKALEAAVQIDNAQPPALPPDAQPVLPSSQPGGPGSGLSLAPPGLQNLSAGLTAPGNGPWQSALAMPGSQGGAIATAGFQPQTGVFSTPLLDQAAQSGVGSGGFAAGSLSPIAPQFMGGWGGFGGSGGSGFGGLYGDSLGGFDTGGSSSIGNMNFTPMTWGG